MIINNNNNSLCRLLLTILGLAIIALGAWRSLELATQQPAIGYGNNYDMARVQSCHDIWPIQMHIDTETLSNSHQAPVSRYEQRVVDTPCYLSSESLFVQLALWTSNEWQHEQTVSIQQIGTTKAVCMLLAVLLCGVLLIWHRQWQAWLINSVIYTAVLSDIGVTLFFNTFFTEFAAVFFLYLSIWGIYFCAKNRRCNTGLVLAAIGLSGLAFSKAQHLPLVLTLCSGLLLLLCWRKTAVMRAVLLAAIVASSIGLAFVNHPSTSNTQVSSLNRTNTLFNLASLQPELVGKFLPPQCEKFAGETWYSTQGSEQQDCMLSPKYSYKDIYFAAFKQPVTVIKNYFERINQVKHWQFNYLGQVEGGKHQAIEAPQLSFSKLLQALSDNSFTLLWLACLLIALLPNANTAVRASIFACACVQLLSYSIAFFGDGLAELPKHSHLSTVSMLCLICFFMIDGTARLARWVRAKFSLNAISSQ